MARFRPSPKRESTGLSALDDEEDDSETSMASMSGRSVEFPTVSSESIACTGMTHSFSPRAMFSRATAPRSWWRASASSGGVEEPPPKPPLEGTYEGESLEGHRHGRGTFVYAHGATYEGEWVQGQRHGAGKLVEADGGTYEGDWMEDLKHGHGKEENADGSGYEGEYRMGQKQGNGSDVFADGNEAFKFISRRSRKGLI